MAQTASPILASRVLEDGRTLELLQMIFNLRLCVGDGAMTYNDAWCFQREDLAWEAFATWDGEGSPYGYYKHVGSQTYQPEFAG